MLTPHAGELGRLLARPSAWVSANRLDAVQAGADDTGTVVLLKGADTLVAGPGRNPVVVDLGGPGLATAGSGDVLTGVVAAFLAKGMEASGRRGRRGRLGRIEACRRAPRPGGDDRPGRGRVALARPLPVRRSVVTVDLAAIRRNAAHLRETAAPAELWAVVKAQAYGHGAVGAARAALEGVRPASASRRPARAKTCERRFRRRGSWS